MTQYVVVDFVEIVNEQLDGIMSDESLPLLGVGIKLARRFHRDCNYKVTDNGTLVVYPVDGRAARDDERIGPVGGYADGVWRRYWYEYKEDEPTVDPRDGQDVYHSGDQRG